jgi:hypothetical protein
MKTHTSRAAPTEDQRVVPSDVSRTALLTEAESKSVAAAGGASGGVLKSPATTAEQR